MKFTAILLLVTCLQVGAKGYSQDVSLSEKNAPLDKIFNKIREQTGYSFLYTATMLKQARTVTINVKNAPLNEVLDQCFANQPFTYTIVEKTIVLKPKEESPNVETTNIIESIDVSGKVTDKEGNALVGANVKVRGTSLGTTTDANGHFELKQIDENAVVEISYVGYDLQTIAVKSKQIINVSLEISIKELDVTIIKGYYTTTKRLNTGDVTKINSKQILTQPVGNSIVALEGLVPGMIINQSSGLPGSNVSIQIRGQNSLIQGSSPLVIIDGVPFNSSSLDKINFGNGTTGQSPFYSINPGDIESIEILKDADATSIYGSRGANGVVIITTKKGKAGKTKFSGNFYSGYEKVAHTINYLKTPQYLQMRREAFVNDNITPNVSNAPDLLVWDTTRYTDWGNLLIGGTACVSDGQFSFSGGNSQTQFLIGSNYHHETTVFPGNLVDDRIGFHTSLSHNSLNNKLSTIFSAIYSNDKNNLIARDITGFINTVPNTPAPFDKDGNLNWSENGVFFTNPLGYTLQNYKAITNNLLSNLSLRYEVLSSLYLKVNFGYSNLDLKQNQSLPKISQNPSINPTSSASFGRNNYSNWIIEPQVQYVSKLKRSKFDFLAGGTFEKDVTDGSLINASNYSSDALLNSTVGASVVNTSIAHIDYKYESVFGRVNYNYSDKYVVNLTGRRDGSSRFGPGKQFANFGSVGLAWIFTQENFFKSSVPFLSYGKLRGSFGTTGNDKIGDYLYLDTWRSAIGNNAIGYQGISGFQPNGLFNPDYAWEINKKFEIGLDLDLFKDKIAISGCFYRNRSGNQLIAYTLPTQTGFTSIFRNFPALIQNAGWEFDISSTNLSKADIKWLTKLNLSIAKNKLLEFPDLTTSSYANQFVIGEPITINKLLHFISVDPQTGVYTFNGTSRPKDQTSIKNLAPLYYGGFQNSLQYKRWQVDILFQFTKQNGYNYLVSNSPPGQRQNQPVEVLKRWQKPGEITSIQKFTTSSGNTAGLAYTNYSIYSDAKITDASFIRLRNIYLSYSLPEIWSSRIKFDVIKFYIQGQNLFTITNYKGNDPELSRTPNIYLPPLRVLSVGVQFTF